MRCVKVVFLANNTKIASERRQIGKELVHKDVCGPLTPVSNGHNQYFLTFIDNYSRKTWVYLLKKKSEVFGYFKDFKTLVEKQSGYYIKTTEIRSRWKIHCMCFPGIS
ncbi:hypothetical protein ACOSQ3_032574 [Xanthoceras sorbifolium]